MAAVLIGRLALILAGVTLAGCAGPGLLGHRDRQALEGGAVVTRTVACGAFANPHAAIFGCVSDVTITVPPGACQAVFVTKPTFTMGEILAQLAPLLPAEICPERIEPYE